MISAFPFGLRVDWEEKTAGEGMVIRSQESGEMRS